MDAGGADGGGVKRPAHLAGAGGAHLPIGGVEVQTPRVPVQAAMTQQAADLRFRIGDQRLVSDLQQGLGREAFAPPGHQCFARTGIAAELGEVVGVGLGAAEQQAVARHAGVHGIAAGVDHPCAGQGRMQQAEVSEVRQRLVDQTGAGGRRRAQPLQIGRAQIPDRLW